MGIGETGNFLAYGIAPASLVAPLGAVTVVSNALLSRIVLKERLSWSSIGGVVLALAGAVLITLNTPSAKPDTVLQTPEKHIYESLASWRSAVLIITMCAGSLFIANPLKSKLALSEEFVNKHVVCYCCICGFMGVITILSAKGISTAVTQLIGGRTSMFVQADVCWLTYSLFPSATISILIQIKYLNIALITSTSSRVVPIYYIIFTTLAVFTGMIVFMEVNFDNGPIGIALFVSGIVSAFAGVYLINAYSTENTTSLKPAGERTLPQPLPINHWQIPIEYKDIQPNQQKNRNHSHLFLSPKPK